MQQVLALLLSLSLLIVLHELGHYFWARLFKTRVEKFYLFFNPYFSLLRAKKVNKKWQLRWFSKKSPEEWSEYPDETEWGLGWIPLGGYCAIAGMIDETKTADSLPKEAQPWEYRSKKAWQRLLIISGGVINNFILAILIYSFVLFKWGSYELPYQNVLLGFDFHPVLIDEGFKNGDIPLEIDHETINSAFDFSKKMLYNNCKEVKVDRNGEIVDIRLPNRLNDSIMSQNIDASSLIEPRVPCIIEGLIDGEPAKEAGILPGDKMIGIDDISTPALSDFVKEIGMHKNEEVTIRFLRDSIEQSTLLTITDSGKIGVIILTNGLKLLDYKKRTYGFFESFPAGIKIGVERLVTYVQGMKLMFTSKEAVKKVGGFGTIGKLFPEEWDWLTFWNMTALLSIILAFMNILPIPALDGGHVMFTLYEMITGKKPGDQFLERAQTVGMILLLALLVYANGNDIKNWLFPS